MKTCVRILPIESFTAHRRGLRGAPRTFGQTNRQWLKTSVQTLLVCSAWQAAEAQISVGTGSASTQNFDGIGTSATATLPANFKVDKQTTVRTVGTYGAAVSATERVDGSAVATAAANGIYNFGSGTTDTGPDRSVGFLASGTATVSGNLYGFFQSASDVSGFTLSYDIEKYRNGTNAAGFTIQAYYSTNGTTFTSLGSSFATSFATDANSNGFTTGPGATVSVTNQTFTLASTLAAGSNFYLAFNYSVTSGTTSSNAQALAIDNFSILGVAAVAPSAFTFFDVNGVNTGSGVPAGNYNFSTATFNVNSAGTGATGAFTSGQTLTFAAGTDGTGAYTISIDVPVSANGIDFQEGNVTLSAGPGTLTLSGANGASLNVEVAATATISQPILGTVGANKIGGGVLTLAAINGFTGNVTVTGGILSVSADGNFGASANDLILAGGTLRSTATISLASGRDLTGTGTLAPAAGTEVSFTGAVNTGALTIADSGTVGLDSTVASGLTKTVTGLTFTSAGVVRVLDKALTLLGAITTTSSPGLVGTATVNGDIDFGASGASFRSISVADGSADVDLLLAGKLSGASVLQKTGAGTLQLTGDNSLLTGAGSPAASLRIGLAGSTPTTGGVVSYTTATALGAGQVQFNGGVLRNDAAGPLVLANSLSIGAQSHGATPGGAVFSGQNIEFQGAVSLFKYTGATAANLQNAVTVNNTTTLSGVFGPSTGSGVTAGLTLAGPGTLVIAGTAPNTFTEAVTVSGATLRLDKTGALAANSSISVTNGGTLSFGNGATTDRIGATTAVNLSGGSLLTNGFSEGSSAPGAGPAMGALTLSTGSTLDFGSGAFGSTLVFTSLNYTGSPITILNWTGGQRSDNGLAGNDRLLFSSSVNFSDEELAGIQFFDDDHNAYLSGAAAISYNGYSELVPVPEPATVFGGLALLGVIGCRERRRLAALLPRLRALR